MTFFSCEAADDRFNNLVAAIEDTDACTLLFRPANNAVEFSDKTCERYNLDKSREYSAESAAELLYPTDGRRCLELCRTIAEGATCGSETVRDALTADSRLKLSLRTIDRDENGMPAVVIGIIEPLEGKPHANRFANREQEELQDANHDPATGALSRKAFNDAVESGYLDGAPAGFMLADIDHFRKLNNTLGSETGEKILRTTAEALMSTFRKDDLVFRVGEDKFAVLLSDCDPLGWDALCRKIKLTNIELDKLLPEGPDVTMSVGACFSDSGIRHWMHAAAYAGLETARKLGGDACVMVDERGMTLDFWKDVEAKVRTKATPSDKNHQPVERENESELLAKALSGAYLMTYDVNPANSNETHIPCETVHPDYRRIVDEFTDFSTLSQRLEGQTHIDCEYLTVTERGWCRASWFPVKRDESGTLVRAFLAIASIDSAKQAEIDKEKDASRLMKLHYDAAESLLGMRALGIALINRETYESESWRIGKDGLEPEPMSFNRLVQHAASKTSSEEREALLHDLELDRILAEVDRAGVYIVSFSFIENEKRRWMQYRFAPYASDPNCLLAVAEDITRLYEEEGRSVQDLYDNVPGGLVTYEWNGATLKTLHVSSYYDKLYGENVVGNPNAPSIPNMENVHPDDRLAFRQALGKAFAQKSDLHHSYRIWNPKKNKYVWAKIDAATKTMPNRHMLVYAMYSDITDEMDAKQNLVKTSESLVAALDASRQLSYEYDPATHRAECYTDANFFNLPKILENYPQVLKDHGVIHPDYEDLLFDTVRKIDGGESYAECDVQMKTDGEYRWYSCIFNALLDENTGRRIAIGLMTDITMRVAAMQSFESRVESLLYNNDGALSIGVFNLTKRLVGELRAQNGIFSNLNPNPSYDEALRLASEGIVNPDDRRRYLEVFDADNLIAHAKSGERQTRMECLYRLTPELTEWVEISAELITNPVTGDVESIGYTRSINNLHFSNLLVDDFLEDSYSMSAVLLNEGSEYYLFDSARGKVCTHRHDYWSDHARQLKKLCAESEQERLAPLMQKEVVLAALHNGEKVSVPFDACFNGKQLRIESHFSVIDEGNGIILASMRNITDESIVEKMRYEALHDTLTGLYNRKTVFEKCQRLLEEHPDDRFYMASVNVRRFRLYNSVFGEEAGDKLLCDIADSMRFIARNYPHCAFGRIEADIFCAFFPLKESALLETQFDQIERDFESYRNDFLIEPSIGLYRVDNKELPIEAMFARATSAAKVGGTRITGCVRLHNAKMEQELSDELEIVNAMRPAMDNNEFAVYLQPKINLQTGQHAGAEALVRWIRPSHGVVSPGKFIPIFESNGFIAELDRYMWEQTCELLRSWEDEGVDVKPVSVNVSRISAYNPTTTRFLKDLVGKYDIAPELLELELTESAYIDDPEDIERTLKDLQDFGFRILMDDFGSGYSSLNTLRELPFDVLKLDMKFLSETCEDDRGRTVLSSVVEMAKKLKLPIIAEGVETEKQAVYLKSLGVRFAQGYLFAKPMPVGDYERLVHPGLERRSPSGE